MALTLGDIKYYGSENNGLGGVISNTILPTTLNGYFDLISATEGTTGMTDYRCIYVKNTTAGANALINGAILRTSDAGDVFTSISIGLAPEGINGLAEIIADENTAPINVTFEETNSPVAFPADLAKDEYLPIWLKRTVVSGSSSINDSTTLAVLGETTA